MNVRGWPFVLMLTATAHAAPVGELFGEVGVDRTMSATGQQWLLPWAPLGRISAPDAIKIAVIDSGVRSEHPQLKGFVLEEADFTGEGPADVLSHGTLIALLAVFSDADSEGQGAILSAKVANAKGEIRKEDVMAAIRWAVAKGAKIVNLSLGFRGEYADFADLDALIAGYEEVIFVAAAGNYGPGVTVYPAGGKAPNLLAVAALGTEGRPLPGSGQGVVAAPGVVPVLTEGAYWYEQGQILAQRGRWTDARAAYEKALQLGPLAEAQVQLGILDLHEKAVNAAILRFKAAVKLNPGLAIAHEHLGTAYFLKQDWVRAERALHESIVLMPDVARAQHNLGQTYLRLNRLAEAREAFVATLSLQPDYPHVKDILHRLDEELAKATTESR